MPKGIPNKKYTGELKQKLVELVRNGGLSQREVSTQYGVSRYSLQLWERIYLEEGPEGLYVERRGRGRPRKQLKPEVEEDLIAEVQRLRSENAYLKKLRALIQEEERQGKGRK
ncbi:transposase [Eubacterium limosum]|uniref:transposase n=1 Tax=Eubacterium limosum TaxID=1736 RepID=UPI003722D603